MAAHIQACYDLEEAPPKGRLLQVWSTNCGQPSVVNAGT